MRIFLVDFLHAKKNIKKQSTAYWEILQTKTFYKLFVVSFDHEMQFIDWYHLFTYMIVKDKAYIAYVTW